MSQSTRLLTTLRFSGTYSSKAEVERQIELKQNVIKDQRNKLLQFAFMTEPQKFCGDNDPLAYVNESVEDALAVIEEETYDLARLEILYDAWDKCHNVDDLGFDFPELLHDAYIEGDFINTVNRPNKSREL